MDVTRKVLVSKAEITKCYEEWKVLGRWDGNTVFPRYEKVRENYSKEKGTRYQ